MTAWSRKSCTASATRWRTAHRCWRSRQRKGEGIMRILLHRADGKTEPWIKDFAKFLPDAEIELWHAGEKCQTCDYAVVWAPPEAMLPELAMVKAIFVTGAGVDALL